MNKESPFGDEEMPSLLKRLGLPVCMLAILVGGGVLVYSVLSKEGDSASKRPQPMVFKAVVVSPPPPPPPPPVQTKQEPVHHKEEMVEQTPVAEDETKPDDAPADSASLSTGITGPGGVDMGLSRGGNGSRIGGKKSGSRFGWYASQVQRSIGDAVQRNPKARLAACVLQVKIWPDASGRITKARLVDSSGDTDLDQVLRRDVLEGLVLKEPPPEDMPLPITLRIRLSRPN